MGNTWVVQALVPDKVGNHYHYETVYSGESAWAAAYHAVKAKFKTKSGCVLIEWRG